MERRRNTAPGSHTWREEPGVQQLPLLTRLYFSSYTVLYLASPSALAHCASLCYGKRGIPVELPGR